LWSLLTFDACARVTEKDEYNVGETDYTYDAEGQLTEASYPAGNTDAFSYDDNGNRTQWARSSDATISYIYNAADQLTQSTEGTIGTSYSHDDNGNLTGQTTSGVTKTFAYDPFDRMTSVSEGGNTLQSMTYGPDGKRLSLTDASGTRKFFYDGNDVIQEYDSSWSTVNKEYTHGPWVDEPLSMTDKTKTQAGDTHYLMKDRLGSIINIMDSNENLKTTYSYDAFGQPTATYHSGHVDCMYRFTGRVYDEAMGNYFYRARYYNQSLGRFFSRDPVFSLGSLYAYCHNSPTNFTDPFGLIAGASIGLDAESCARPCGPGVRPPCWDPIWAFMTKKATKKEDGSIKVKDSEEGNEERDWDEEKDGDEEMPLYDENGDVIGYVGKDGKGKCGSAEDVAKGFALAAKNDTEIGEKVWAYVGAAVWTIKSVWDLFF